MNNKNFVEYKRKEMQNEYSKEIDRKTMESQKKNHLQAHNINQTVQA